MRQNVRVIRDNIELIDNLPNSTKSRISGVKKMRIWHKGNEVSMYLIRDLVYELEERGLKIIGYANGNKGMYEPLITLITVEENYLRPAKSADIEEKDIITKHEFKNSLSIGANSPQYKILFEILEEIKRYPF